MYQHGKRTKQPRNMAVFLATIAVMGVVVLGVWFIIHRDVANTTAPKTNVPIVTEVGVDDGSTIVINEDLFKMELPSDWKLVEHEQQAGGKNEYRWSATKQGSDDRRLTLYIDAMPQSYKLVKMWPLTPRGSQFSLGNLSDNCINFAGEADARPEAQGNAPVAAKWENVSFICDPVINNQTIGTGTPGGSIGTVLDGTGGAHTYFFYYEDYNIYPDDNILRLVLSSFTTK